MINFSKYKLIFLLLFLKNILQNFKSEDNVYKHGI